MQIEVSVRCLGRTTFRFGLHCRLDASVGRNPNDGADVLRQIRQTAPLLPNEIHGPSTNRFFWLKILIVRHFSSP